jgi:predicted transcriptional regulator
MKHATIDLERSAAKMQTIPLNPELQIALENLSVFARAHGQTTPAALHDAVSTYLQAQSETLEEDVAAIQQGCDDVKAGRTVSLDQFEKQMRQKYDIPR